VEPELPRPPEPHPDRLLVAALLGAVAFGLVPPLLGGCIGGLVGHEPGDTPILGG
jgi:hypothetical protein